MTTLYIAGPMTGLPEKNHPAFMAADETLTHAGYKTLNPVNVGEHPTEVVGEQVWKWYIRRTISMLALEADGIALLDGWESSRGARLEVDIADGLRLPVRSVQSWIRSALA